MIEYRTVAIGEPPYQLHVWQKSKTVWLAMGECMGEQLTGDGRSENAAIKDWRDKAARKRDKAKR